MKNTSAAIYEYEECLTFDIQDFRENTAWYGEWPGAIRPQFKVQLEQQEY